MDAGSRGTRVPVSQAPASRLRATGGMSPDLPAHNLPCLGQGTTATHHGGNQGGSPGAHKSPRLSVHCGNSSFSVCMYLCIPSDTFIIMR